MAIFGSDAFLIFLCLHNTKAVEENDQTGSITEEERGRPENENRGGTLLDSAEYG